MVLIFRYEDVILLDKNDWKTFSFFVTSAYMQVNTNTHVLEITDNYIKFILKWTHISGIWFLRNTPLWFYYFFVLLLRYCFSSFFFLLLRYCVSGRNLVFVSSGYKELQVIWVSNVTGNATRGFSVEIRTFTKKWFRSTFYDPFT